MGREDIIELSPESILIVKRWGQLKRLQCPFSVLLLVKIDGLKEGEEYIVRLVVPHTTWVMSYIIQGRSEGYPYYCFAIL